VDDETNYTFSHVNFFSVTMNSKALIMSSHRNLTIEYCRFTDVICNGNENDSSIIHYDSGDNKRSLIINKSSFSNIITNGPIIKIKGEHNNVTINLLEINNVNSYGPLIENTSLNV